MTLFVLVLAGLFLVAQFGLVARIKNVSNVERNTNENNRGINQGIKGISLVMPSPNSFGPLSGECPITILLPIEWRGKVEPRVVPLLAREKNLG